MSKLEIQIRDARFWLDELARAVEAGKTPEIADARLLRTSVQLLESLVCKAAVDAITERTAEADKSAQVVMAAKHHRRADELDLRSDMDAAGLKDDSEPVLSGARDNRPTEAA